MAHCDFLTGTVSVGVDAPSELLEEPEKLLPDFYKDPNNPRWNSISRILYHESVHFWQIYSSGYIAHLTHEAWSGLLNFEATGKALNVPNVLVSKEHDQPFSSGQLAECWARFWDVHTRSPAKVREEDTLEDALLGRPKRASTPRSLGGYRLVEFDDLLTSSQLDAEYAEPFRWLLQVSGKDSNFAHAVFPHFCHLSFATPDPVGSFTAAIKIAVDSIPLRRHIRQVGETEGYSVNRVWPIIGGNLLRLFGNVIVDRGLPSFTSGVDVIQRSRELGRHPVHARYVRRVAGSLGEVSARARVNASREMQFAAAHPMGAFCLPGQPDFRSILGAYVPPARVRFRNGDVVARLEGIGVARSEAGQGATFAEAIADLDERIARYRAALNQVGVVMTN